MTKQKETVIEKLAKLKAKEISARDLGNMEEAEAFAEGISRMLLKHNLEMSEVELFEQKDKDPVQSEVFHPSRNGIKFKRRRIEWQERLAGIIAYNNFCQILVVPRTNIVYFVGRKEHRQVAAYLYGYLGRTIEDYAERAYMREYDRLYNSGQSTYAVRGWKAAFIDGAVNAIGQRLRKMRAEELQTAGERGVALVRVQDNAVVEWMEEQRAAKKFSGNAGSLNVTGSTNMDGYRKGKEFGGSLSLNQGVGSGSSASQRSIKGGS